jgi:putative membrane protein
VARFPRHVFGSGEEPDPRFSLANERTFLSWIRTALALVLAGVALEALDAPVQAEMRLASALIFVALGLVAIVHAWLSWAATERSMRVAQPLPGLPVGAIIATGAAIATVGIIVGSLMV